MTREFLTGGLGVGKVRFVGAADRVVPGRTGVARRKVFMPVDLLRESVERVALEPVGVT